MTDNLPPLPDRECSLDGGSLDLFTAEQMRDYAREALAAAPQPPLQDCDSDLSKALAEAPHARLHAKEAAAAIAQPPAPTAPAFDMLAHLRRQAEFSARTFGPGARVEGVTDHIAKELIEVRESGGDLAEWIDVVILALDGCWRSGASPEQIIEAMVAKQTKNEGRKWPDWRTAPAGKAIEHDRSAEVAQPVPATGAQPLTLDVIREAKQDAMEVFDAKGPETPQTIRDVIDYMASWLEVYVHKRASQAAAHTGSAAE